MSGFDVVEIDNPVEVQGTDGSTKRTLATDTSGRLKVLLYDAAGNPLKYHDLDSGAGTENNLGVSLRRAASGGSVALGTSTDPLVTSDVLGADRSGSGTIIALNGVVAANTQGASSVVFVVSGTWSAAMTIEGTVDGGTWIPVHGTYVSGITVALDGTMLSALSVNGQVLVSCGGFSQVRLRANPFVSGSIQIAWNAAAGLGLLQVYSPDASALRAQVQGAAADGAALSGNPVLVAGQDGTAVQSLLTDTGGRLIPTLGIDRSGSGTLTAVGTTVAMNTVGASAAGFNITGAWTATLLIEATTDGTTWFGVFGLDPAGGGLVSALTANIRVVVSCAGYQQVRLRCSVYTTGTATVAWNVNQGTNMVLAWCMNPSASLLNASVGGLAPDGSALLGNPVTVAGSDGVNVQALLTDTLGRQQIVMPTRNRVSIIYQAVATATADTLLSLIKRLNGSNPAGATSIAATVGQTLRITSMTFSVKANAVAAAFASFTLRINAAGAAIISSPSELRVDLGNTEALAGSSRMITIPFPDGLEISGTTQLAVSASAQAVTNILSVALNGYEYTT